MEIGDKKGERVVGTDPEEGLICSGKRLVNSNLLHNVSQRLREGQALVLPLKSWRGTKGEERLREREGSTGLSDVKVFLKVARYANGELTQFALASLSALTFPFLFVFMRS